MNIQLSNERQQPRLENVDLDTKTPAIIANIVDC